MSGLEAFKSFNFDGDEKWQSYLLNIEVPPGKDREAALARVKAKWYKRNVDSEFDVSLVAPPPQQSSTRPDAPPPRPASPPPQQGPRPTPGYGYTSTARNAPGAGGGSPAASTGGMALVGMQVAMLLCLPLWLQPLKPAWSRLAYMSFLQLGAAQHMYKVYLRHGLPRLRPFSLAALQSYFAAAATSADLQYGMQCLMFAPQPQQFLALVSPATLALYHVVVGAKQKLAGTALWAKHGQRAYDWLATNREAMMQNCAVSEIFLGFSLIVSLLHPRSRNLFLLLGYWQLLKVRYFSPDFSAYHCRVWSMLGTKAAPYLDRVPILRTPIEFVKRWFLSVPTARR